MNKTTKSWYLLWIFVSVFPFILYRIHTRKQWLYTVKYFQEKNGYEKRNKYNVTNVKQSSDFYPLLLLQFLSFNCLYFETYNYTSYFHIILQIVFIIH